STITAASGGAIDCAGTVTVTNSLFAANLANGAAKNCRQTGVYNSGDYNFTDTGGAACGATAAHDFNAASTGVATALADNGGPVLTLALSSSSSARDAIPNASCGGVTTDARALTRPSASSTSCDVGAFEY
ncbi:MAG: choice-of-anchor Q domain-containing protein, partial [Bdellovibrionota bacterium]